MSPTHEPGHWYLIHTKIRQELLALENLQRQGYLCYLPMIRVERLRRKILHVDREPLFPRYLFIRLQHSPQSQSWAPIRSTLGVTRLVSFGMRPAKLDDTLVEQIQQRIAQTDVVRQRFEAGETVRINAGPFKGIEAVFQLAAGMDRVVVLFELMGKATQLQLEPHMIQKAD